MASVILPPVPQVARFAVNGTWQTRPFVNIFHGQYSQQPGDPPTMDTVCEAVKTAFVNSFGAAAGGPYSITSVTGQDLASRTGAIGTTSTTFTGLATGAVSSVQIAICASWIIQDRYRGGHPRTYIAGCSTVDTSNGYQLNNTTGLPKWKNAAAAFLTDFNGMTAAGGTWKLVCVRYYSNHQLLVSPLVRPILSSTVHPRLDSMRRRLGKETP